MTWKKLTNNKMIALFNCFKLNLVFLFQLRMYCNGKL